MEVFVFDKTFLIYHFYYFYWFYQIFTDCYQLLQDFSLSGITVSFSRLERAMRMITRPFCIILHAEAEFEIKTAPSLTKTKKTPAVP